MVLILQSFDHLARDFFAAADGFQIEPLRRKYDRGIAGVDTCIFDVF